MEGYYSMNGKGLSHNLNRKNFLSLKTSIFFWCLTLPVSSTTTQWHLHHLLHESDETATTVKNYARKWPHKHQLHHLHHHQSLQPLTTNTTICHQQNNQALVPYFLRLTMDPQQTLCTSPPENITSISSRTTNTTTASICANYAFTQCTKLKTPTLGYH